MYQYATTMRRGYFGASTKVFTRHLSAAAAQREADRHAYTDARGQMRHPVAAVFSPYGFRRDETIYGDNSYPDYAE